VLVGPVAAGVLPVGVDFLGRPFSEPTLLKIAGAYEHATKLRHAPPISGAGGATEWGNVQNGTDLNIARTPPPDHASAFLDRGRQLC